MCINNNEINTYKALNKLAPKNGVVILGSTYMHDMPIAELRQLFGIKSDIYNRSLTDLTINEAKNIIEDTMKSLMPKKLLINLGEIELNNRISEDKIIDELSELIKLIKSIDSSCKLVLVSIPNETYSSFNKKLESYSDTNNYVFADIETKDITEETHHISVFKKLKFFMIDDTSIIDLLTLT